MVMVLVSSLLLLLLLALTVGVLQTQQHTTEHHGSGTNEGNYTGPTALTLWCS